MWGEGGEHDEMKMKKHCRIWREDVILFPYYTAININRWFSLRHDLVVVWAGYKKSRTICAGGY
jgi:hypothetical protein